MESVVHVDPFRCRVWSFHDRLQEHITEDNCKAEIQSFLEHGQLVPVLGRRASRDASGNCEVELIYGARRLFVARLINKPLLVELRNLSDREGIIAMDMENRQRRDVSPYERGLSYMRWLRAGYFESQEDLARALKVSPSQVSRLLKLAQLPSVIVNAFSSGLDICEGWGVQLAEAVQDPERRRPTIQAARQIAGLSPRPPAREIYRQLLTSPVHGRKPRAMAHDKVIRAESGAPLFRIRQQRNAIVVILPIERVSAMCLEQIESSITRILQSPSSASSEARDVRLAAAPL